MSKEAKVIVTTPIGEVSWFSLVNPDKFNTYSCALKLEDSPETHKLISKIDSMGEGRRPYEKQDDGSYVIKLRLKAKGMKKTGDTYEVNPPTIYNSIGKKMSNEELQVLSIGNGTEARVKIELAAYIYDGKAGVSAKPKAVQISKLVEFNGGDLGFDALELEEIDEGESKSSEPASKPSGSYDF